MKLWVDDVRPAPEGYVWVTDVNGTIATIIIAEAVHKDELIEVIDIDHDSGGYAQFGGDYVNVLNWLEATGRNYPIHIHSMNPVGVKNMRRIIKANGWKEV